MRNVIWFVLLFGVAVVAALTLGSNDGLVSLYWNSWRVDVSLNLFLLVLLGSCFALVTIIQSVEALISLPRRARLWRQAQRERSAQAALREALADFYSGRYSRAQKAAQKALTIQSQTPDLASDGGFEALVHLMAAHSAHRLQDRRHRDEHLRQALAVAQVQARAQEEGARLLAAEWALEDRDAPRALELLSELNPGVARRTQALRLKLQACRLARLPLEALRTARLLAKHQGFSKSAAQGLLRSLASEVLDSARDLDQLRSLWQQLDGLDRRDVFVAVRAAQRAAALGAPEDGRGWLRPFWDAVSELAEDEREALAEALVQCMPGLGPEWLLRLEQAQQRAPRDASIRYALAHALAERQLWGKARLVLEQCAEDRHLAAAARRRCWLLLADMAQSDGDAERRALCFESAARTH
ncbi:heme biosynthesis HemY N-terminal domain-containing protein [Roseateles sp. BYS180W]|uniref:Heme biosynthesis HemY N-terminal domain-containing protein n=1 Tax=Roseateles rivi TaxID=3299028 RepID=A0ABW7FVK3_9BURK